MEMFYYMASLIKCKGSNVQRLDLSMLKFVVDYLNNRLVVTALHKYNESSKKPENNDGFHWDNESDPQTLRVELLLFMYMLFYLVIM